MRALVLVLVLSACGKGGQDTGVSAGSAPSGGGAPPGAVTSGMGAGGGGTGGGGGIGSTAGSPIDAICARATECKCPGADKCSATFAALGDALPPGLAACAAKHVGDACEAYCSPATGKACLDQFGAELNANLDKRAAQVTAVPAALQQRVGALCGAVTSCGCDTGCAANLGAVADVLPETTWSCLEGLAKSGCEATCDAQRQTACVGDLNAITNASRQKLPGKLCTKRAACGCADPGCEPEWSKVLASSTAPADLANLMQCGLALDCAGTCASWDGQDSAFARRCVAPVKAALARESEQDRRHHETMMKLIGNISARSTDVYRDGVYQYSY